MSTNLLLSIYVLHIYLLPIYLLQSIYLHTYCNRYTAYLCICQLTIHLHTYFYLSTYLLLSIYLITSIYLPIYFYLSIYLHTCFYLSTCITYPSTYLLLPIYLPTYSYRSIFLLQSIYLLPLSTYLLTSRKLEQSKFFLKKINPTIIFVFVPQQQSLFPLCNLLPNLVKYIFVSVAFLLLLLLLTDDRPTQWTNERFLSQHFVQI